MSDYDKGPIDIEDRSKKPIITILVNADASLSIIKPDGDVIPYDDAVFNKIMLGYKSADTGELSFQLETKLADNPSNEARERLREITKRLVQKTEEMGGEVSHEEDQN